MWLGRLAPAGIGELLVLVAAVVVASTAAPATAREGTREEVVSARTATTKTFRNGDGTYTKSLYAGPVHYRENGRWKAIDSSVVPVWGAPPSDPLGSSAAGYGYRNSANRFGTLFKSTLGAGFLRFDVDRKPFDFTLEGAMPVKATTSGSRIAYRGALPATDLEYELQPEGLKETLVLRDASAPSSFRFVLSPPRAGSVDAQPRRDGSWAFRTSGHGAPAFVLHAPFADDAGGAAKERGKSRRALSRDKHSHVGMTVTEEDGRYVISLQVDQAWLRDPARKFPVRIDPTVTVQPTSRSAEFEATCGTCQGWDWGSVWIGTDDYAAYRGAFQFDLGQIPPGASVSNAKLSLYNQRDWCIYTTRDVCGDRSHQLDVHRMTAAWTPNTRTNALAYDASPLASYTLPVGAGDNWMAWTVTSAVQGWVSGTTVNNGFLVKRNTEPLDAGGPEVPGGTFADGDASLRPKLDVTYASDAVQFPKPEILHGNGADLRWSRFDGSTGAAFDRYEVHRSSTATFTPSASTLLATIRDVAVTSYRDTTAAPNKAFTYKIVTNGAPSIGQTVTLPAAGQGSVLLQPGPEEGQDTYLDHDPSYPADDCLNWGHDEWLYAGADLWVDRPVFRFDTSAIPAGAPITNATLSLFVDEPSYAPVTIGVHKLKTAWREGSGIGECTGDGATWAETQGGVPWSAKGGDFDATAAATKAHTATDTRGWDDFNVTSIVKQWADGTAPNLGVLLKATDESDVEGKSLIYLGDDHTINPKRRPKLAITFADGSVSQVPTVSLSSPGPGDSLEDTVDLAAAATDDRRVEQVEFLVDGATVSTDTTAPFSYAWNTTTAANGAHTLTARATDDVGNAKTSDAVSVTVGNSAPPSTRVTTPSSVYEDLVKADGPNAWWRLGETTGTTAADASGNGRSGTYGGTYTLGQPGLLAGNTDKAVKLGNGTTDGSVTVSTMGGVGAAQITAEAWLDYAGVATTSGESRVIARSWGNDGGWWLSVYKDAAGVQRARWVVRSAGISATALAQVTPGKLHLAGTYDGSALKLYVNGALAGSASTAAAAALNTTAPVLLGQTLDVDQSLDEAAVYTRPLSADAIRRHYEVGKALAPSVTGDTAVEAAAADDGSVSKVEFYVDGSRYAEDTAAPFTASLKTKDEAEPTYDGSHVLTTKAYDNHGQVTKSNDQTVNVVNAAGSKYLATFTSTEFPQAMVFDPAGGAVQDKAGIDVTVTNKSTVTWSATDIVLRYRWVSPDPANPAPQMTTSADIPLGVALAPNATRTMRALVEPPSLPEGVDKAQYQLRFDLFEKSSSSWFAAKGNQPLENPVIVRKALEMALGLERYYHYDGEELGGGMQHLANVANGNSIIRWTPWQAPGRGLSTVLDLTYNSLEKKCECPAGNNVSLSISGLTRFGNPIDVHPNKADTIAGNPKRYVEITDGDGATHRFIGKQHADGTVYWEEPDGVHLYLRTYSTTDPARKWALTRPDRVTFFYDVDGYPTSVEDGNGNRLTFTLEDVPPGGDPGGPKKRITSVRDAGGRSFTVSYYSKDDAKKPQIRGKVKRITDHGGHAIDFTYYEDGNLLRLTQRGGTNADGSFLADRSWVFTYTTSNGEGPAIPAAADRANPDSKIGNQSTRIFSVRDPRGAETTFTYLGSGNGNDRWKLASRTDRLNAKTTYSYDTLNRTTTMTAPLARVSKFTYDAEGKLTKLVDPKNETTSLEWTAGRNVRKVTESGGAISTYDYDDNGAPTKQTHQVGPRSAPVDATTTLTYEYVAIDAGDVAGKWKAGRTKPHISQLDTKTEPKGTASATAGDFQWGFDYDARGNLTRVVDPEDAVTQHVYHADGTLDYTLDAENRKTDFNLYDANGMATEIVDAENQRTRFGYDADGLLLWTQDPEHALATGTDTESYRSYLYYDSFHRMGRQSAPKSTAHDRGNLIWSAADFDANDNTVAVYAGAFGRQFTRGAKTTSTYDAMDRVRSQTGPDTTVAMDGSSANPGGEKTTTEYDAAGRISRITTPRGNQTATVNDNAVELTYDPLDRVIKQTRYEYSGGVLSRTLHTHFCFDTAGDLVRLTKPKAGVASVDCNAATPPSFTSRFEYDPSHQLLSETDPEGRKRAQTYDLDGNIETVTDERGKIERRHYDERDRMFKVEHPFDTGRPVTTRLFYDKVGNVVRSVSPRGWDASTDKATFTDFVTGYTYDKVDRLTKVAHPTKGGANPTFSYTTYDKNGNPTMTSLPSAATTVAALTADEKTTMTQWDPGWIRSSVDPASQQVRYDYTAEGRQASRTPENGGEEDLTKRLTWEYWADGLLKAKKDRGKQQTRYFYDANGNLTTTDDAGGVTSNKEAPMDIRATFDDLDRPTKVRQQKIGKETDWNVTLLGYDLNGNVTDRTDSRVETGAGAVVKAGRKYTFTYDNADWMKTMDDAGKDAASATDDRRTTTQYFPTGWEQTRTITKNGATKQVTNWTYFDNGKLKTLETRNGGGSLKESHTVGYVQNGIYVNGHRTSDAFTRDNPNTAAPCRTGTCTKTYTYDARDRLLEERTDRGTSGVRTNTYELDVAGNVVREAKAGKAPIRYRFEGNQLTEQLDDAFNPQFEFHYENADLDCVTKATGSADDCGTGAAAVAAEYSYDDFHRLLSSTRFDGAGGTVDSSSYVYDALDRPVEETEKHTQAADRNRTTTMTYLGLSDAVTEEKLTYDSATSTRPSRTKSYSYDAAGHRITMTDQKGNDAAGAKDYTYGTDVHGSVSLLLDDTGTAKAAYGYDAYGGRDDDMTREVDPDSPTGGATSDSDPLNPYRYSGKRLDSGSGTLDMGARRFSPDTGRFLQQDFFDGALDNLGLASDPLTQNRYSLAAGNPVSFVETDGHMVSTDGGGGSAPVHEASGDAPLSDAASSDGYADIDSGASSSSSGDDQSDFEKGLESSVNTIEDTAGWLERSTNIFSFDDYKEQSEANWEGLKGGVSNIFSQSPEEIASETFAPLTDAYDDGGLDQAAGALPGFLVGTVGGKGAGRLKPGGKKPVDVYQSRGPGGKPQYVGITNDLRRRAAQHLADPNKGFNIQAIQGLPKNMSRYDARNVEQALIQKYKLGKHGGSLTFNKINSISPLNPFYSRRVQQGERLLRQANFPGF